MRYNRAFRYTALLVNPEQLPVDWHFWSSGIKKSSSNDTVIYSIFFVKSANHTLIKFIPFKVMSVVTEHSNSRSSYVVEALVGSLKSLSLSNVLHFWKRSPDLNVVRWMGNKSVKWNNAVSWQDISEPRFCFWVSFHENKFFSDTSEHRNKFPDLLFISMNFVTNMNYCYWCDDHEQKFCHFETKQNVQIYGLANVNLRILWVSFAFFKNLM
jgi:hypothetical protein